MQWQNLFGLLWIGATLCEAAPLTSATVTETKNDVRYQAATAGERSAKLQDTMTGADVLRTGERSLAEIEFNDKTITRLGSKSVFSFEANNREFRVDKGLALICMPKGAGGGRIVTAAITAAIEGTTVLALGSGKIIFLEGTGTVTTNDGKQKKQIAGGQIAFIEDGILKVTPILLDPLLQSRLIGGRKEPLPTWPQIQKVAGNQHGPGGVSVNDPAFRDEGMIELFQPGRKPPQSGDGAPPPNSGQP